MNPEREARYLQAQRYIIFLALVGIIVTMFVVMLQRAMEREVLPEREIAIAAQACFDQGMRAILHRDGTIECRP